MTPIPEIENQSCGCDTHGAKHLISMDEALARINRSTHSIAGTCEVPLADALGRVLSVSVRALGMVPPFANSAMDGYAVNTADLVGDGPWVLPVAARVAAGHSPQNVLARGTAAQVFTGAPVPDGANAVIMQENVKRTQSGIKIDRKIAPRTHIRAAGEDMTQGKIIVPAGRCISTRDIAAIAAAGHGTVTLQRRLKVGLLVTGDEVYQPGQARGTAGIWDVNTPMIHAAMNVPSIELCHVETAPDTRAELKARLKALSESVDLIVTTGGISVGEEDHVKPALSELNATITFSGVAIKPGKPISLGAVGKAVWMGLPGNPLSAFVMWQVFGKALCRALTGQTDNLSKRRNVVLSEPLKHKPGRCELRLARLVGFDQFGREVAQATEATHSGRVAILPDMDGLLFIPADTENLPRGALVEFLPFE